MGQVASWGVFIVLALVLWAFMSQGFTSNVGWTFIVTLAVFGLIIYTNDDPNRLDRKEHDR